jgi:pilus assembly protein Flp/PilA
MQLPNFKNLEEEEMEKIRNFFKDESGASAAEYGLLVSLVAVAIIIGVRALGTAVNTKVNDAAGNITAG